MAAGGIVPRRTEGVGIGGQDGGCVVEDNMATSGAEDRPTSPNRPEHMDRRVDHELVPWCACPPCAGSGGMRVSMKDGHLPGGASVSCTFHLLFSRRSTMYLSSRCMWRSVGLTVVLETTCRPTLPKTSATAS